MLEKLRAKPDHHKKRIALVLTVVIFCAIIFVWVSSWDARSHESDIQGKAVAPLSGFSAMFDGLQLSIKDMLSGTPTFIEANPASSGLTATTTKNDDAAGVVIIDSSGAQPTSTPPKTIVR